MRVTLLLGIDDSTVNFMLQICFVIHSNAFPPPTGASDLNKNTFNSVI